MKKENKTSVDARLEEIEAEIEKIKSALMSRNPDFKRDFCKHEAEIVAVWDYQEHTYTTKPIPEPAPYWYRCKKCGLSLDKDGNPIIHRI